MMLFDIPYNRTAAVEYANRWAYFRNPEFYDFSAIGGDCTKPMPFGRRRRHEFHAHLRLVLHRHKRQIPRLDRGEISV